MKPLALFQAAGSATQRGNRAVAQAAVGLWLASILLAVVSLAHFARFWFGWQILVNGSRVGLGVSAIGFFIAGGLSLWLWKLAVCLGRTIPEGKLDPAATTRPNDEISSPKSARQQALDGL